MEPRLRKALLIAAAILSAHGVAEGRQGTRTELAAASISISVVLPPGLQPFSEQQMALVRQNGVPAKFVFSDPKSDVMLVVNTFGSNADEKGLPEVAEQIKAAAEKQSPHFERFERDFITMDGKKWLRLSYKEGTGDDELIDTYYVTDWAGEYVLFNFSSTVAKYESYKSAFERSAQSVRLGFIARAIDLNPKAVKRPRRKPRR